MHLYSTSSVHGILDHTEQMPGQTQGSCRVAEFAGRLYCVYLDGVADAVAGNLKVISRSSTSGWTEPQPVLDDLRCRFTPHLFVFNGKMHLLACSDIGVVLLSTWDGTPGRFGEAVVQRHLQYDLTPTTAVLKGKLHLFYTWANHGYIGHCSTTDLAAWRRESYSVTDASVPVRTNLSPVAITYQGLIHLVYKSKKGGFHLVNFDDNAHCTRPRVLVAEDYGHSPGIAVHNGLLKLLFSTRTDMPFDLYAYGYDGNALSAPTRSSALTATESPSAAVLDGALVVCYRGALEAPEPISGTFPEGRP